MHLNIHAALVATIGSVLCVLLALTIPLFLRIVYRYIDVWAYVKPELPWLEKSIYPVFLFKPELLTEKGIVRRDHLLKDLKTLTVIATSIVILYVMFQFFSGLSTS